MLHRIDFSMTAVLVMLSALFAETKIAYGRTKPSYPHYILRRPLNTNRVRRGHIRGQPFPATDLEPGVEAMRAFEEAGLLMRDPGKRTELPDRKRTESALQPPAPTDLPEWMQNLKLPEMVDSWRPEFIKYLNFYRNTARGRSIVRSWYVNKSRFENLIRRELEQAGLPEDLIMLAAIESGFRPQTRSYAGAAGLWQFMPLGGRIYGMESGHWLDERLNPERSTRAAMLYLKDLHFRFGDWFLALSAYNAGYAAVAKSIRRFNTNSYWKLCDLEAGLPYETTNYVPKLLAVITAGYNKEEFGLDKIKPGREWSYSIFTVRQPVHLKKLARTVGVSYDELVSLNPELVRRRVPPGYKSFQIRIPRGSEEAFNSKGKSFSGNLRGYRVHTVKFGENLTEIAADYNTTRARIRRLNRIRSSSELEPGLQILVPEIKDAGKDSERDEDDTDEEDDGDDAEQEREAGLIGSRTSKKILVAVPARPACAPEDHRRVFYRVTSADNLERLLEVFAVTKEDLLMWNNLNPEAKLQWGMILQVFVSPDTDLSNVRLLDPAHLRVEIVDSPGFREEYLKSRGLVRYEYTAREGDTIKSLSKRFGLSIGSIARLNSIGRFTSLQPGQRIIVYVSPDSPAGRSLKSIRKK